MTKDEAIDQYEHTFAGMVLDAWAQNREGTAQVQFFRRITPKVREMLGRLFDDALRVAREDEAKFVPPDGSKRDLNELFGNDKKKGKKDVEA